MIPSLEMFKLWGRKEPKSEDQFHRLPKENPHQAAVERFHVFCHTLLDDIGVFNHLSLATSEDQTLFVDRFAAHLREAAFPEYRREPSSLNGKRNLIDINLHVALIDRFPTKSPNSLESDKESPAQIRKRKALDYAVAQMYRLI